jgi:hypothetical protein
LDTVLRTAADEVYMALGLSEVSIHLVPPSRVRVAAEERE